MLCMVHDVYLLDFIKFTTSLLDLYFVWFMNTVALSLSCVRTYVHVYTTVKNALLSTRGVANPPFCFC